MPNDFKRKEPNKTEKVLYELFMQQQGMERNLMTNSALLISIAIQMKIEPEKLAEMLSDNPKIKEYSDKINKKIDELETERRAKETSAEKAQSKESQENPENPID
jgi:acetyl-CoA carboxylase beta subunit